MSERATVTVTGTGRAQARPDVARVRLTCTSEDETAAAAFDACSSVTAAVIAALREWGVSEDDLSTEGIDLSRNHRNREEQPYLASNALSVDVRPPERAGELLQRALEAGGDALAIGRLQFVVADPEPALAQARAAAVRAARQMAEELASAAGMSLGRLVSIEEGPGRVRPMGVQAMAARAAPVEVADQLITVIVSAVFEMEDSPPG